MTRRLALSLAVALLATASPRASDSAAPEPAHNTLSPVEKAAGWRLLFDGRTPAGWRGFKKEGFPERGWIIEDGCLRHLGDGRGGDLITVETFSHYEFAFDWLIHPGGNSGVKYFITEERSGAIGHEYQLLGPRTQREALRTPRHQATGAFYDIAPVSTNALPRPPGEWNHSRLIVRGHHIEHWLNGEQVLAYSLDDPVIQESIAASKFKDVPGFGTHFPHHLLLQDHGGDIRFRNLKLRPLEP
ncbi:MAG: DUF1080 domain-containing protein [Verrucomicrobiae bacterium]|nr:DUF1080 domain-containing protein [Verrucomicrobiae bacterium]